MTIKGLLIWKNPDSTRDLNAAWGPVQKGVYEGGAITPSGANLTITVDPFIAKSKDGMTVVSDNPEVLTLTAGTTQYLVLLAKYEISTPTLQLQLVSQTTWQTSVNKDYFITFAKFVTPGAAVAATSATITYDDCEYSDKLGKSPWRSSVANFAALPTAGNRDGDARITLDTFTVYLWDATTSTWVSLNTTSNLSEITTRKPLESMVERLAVSTSGLIGGVLNDLYTYSTDPTHAGIGMSLVEQPAPNQLGFGALHAYVHGHFIKRHAEVLNLAAAPGVGTRYDVVYIEVWQETITTAMGVGYENNSLGTDTLAQVLTHFNQALEQDLSPNHTIEAIDLVDPTTLIITKSSLRTQAGIPAGSTSDPANAMIAATNQFGNLYVQNANSDRFAYTANAPAIFSTRTWAIPLLVLKRRATEGTFVVFDGGTGDRYAFDVAPRATLGKGLTDTIGMMTRAAYEKLLMSAEHPSGFLNGAMTRPLEIGSTVGTGIVRIPNMTARVYNNEVMVPSADVALPSVTALVAGGRRDIVYAEFFLAHAPARSTDIPVGGSQITMTTNQGLQSYQWFIRYVAASVGSNTDEVDSMTSLGFTQSGSDVALWGRPSTDDEPTATSTVYALPIAIVHRRNSAAWDVAANPNGHTGRPDIADIPLQTDIHPREIVDLRRAVVSASDIPSIVDNSFNKLVTGELRTKLQPHPYSTDVYGTSALMTTLTSAAPVAGKHVITPVPAAGNANNIWSDSEEVVALSFYVAASNVASSSADGVFAWDGGGDTGTLTITAPTGMHVMSTGNNTIQGPFTRQDVGTFPAWNKSYAIQIDSTVPGVAGAPEYTATQTVTVVTTDPGGRPTQITVSASDWVAGAPANASMSFTVWFVKPHKDLAAVYSGNGALFGSPTKVYSVTSGGSTINVGPITATISTTVTGTTFTITQAQIAAARPDIATAAAAIRIYGLMSIRVQGSTATPRYVRLTDAAGALPDFLRMEVEFGVALGAGTPVEVVVMCDGDLINRWVEIVPESRQFRGFYFYATSANNSEFNGLNHAGYAGRWSDRSGVPQLAQRGASFADMSVQPLFGMECGVISGATERRDHVDYLVAAVTANSHTIWFQDADGVTLGLGPIHLGITRNNDPVSLLTGTGNSTSGGVLPSNSPYTQHAFAYVNDYGAYAHTTDVTFIGVGEISPTNAIEIVYEIPAYQGLTDTAQLQSRLRGLLAHVADPVVTTEGYNAPLLPLAVASSAHAQLREANPYLLNPAAISTSTYRSPDRIVVDAGSFPSVGTVVSDVRKRSRRRVSMLRQVPYPGAPSTANYLHYSAPTNLRHSAVDQRPMVRTVVQHYPAPQGVFSKLNDQLYDDAGSETTGANLKSAVTDYQYYWPFNIPVGAVLRNVRVTFSDTDAVGPATLTFYLIMSSRQDARGLVHRLGKAVYAYVLGEMNTLYFSPYLDNQTAFNYQNLASTNTFAVFLSAHSAAIHVTSIEVEYMELLDRAYGTRWNYDGALSATNYLFTDIGYDALQVSQKAWDPKSSMRVDLRDVGIDKALVGRNIVPPSTWSAPELAALESAVFTSGAVDSTSDWQRGVTARVANASWTYYEAGLFGYVPFSGSVLRDLDYENASLPELTTAKPVSTPDHVVRVSTAASDTAQKTCAVATVTPYAMINANKELALGVSTGVWSNAEEVAPVGTRLSGRSNVHSVQVGGSTIDAFFPLGRPVVESK